jgi:glucose-1-phosphate cytidylyltransferase
MSAAGMKAIILAGGAGTRLSEETAERPKPMVEIGGHPILWHIMKHYGTYGINDFIICLGYKGQVIKDWFASYRLRTADVTMDLGTGETAIHNSWTEPWRVTLLETGATTMTGGRLKQALAHVAPGEDVCLTYGDGVADVDLDALVDFHRSEGALATVTAVQPAGRFGALDVSGSRVSHFQEKPRGDGMWTNGGFFVVKPEVAEYIGGPETVWESEPMRRLAEDGQLASYRHEGSWHVMDTLNDKRALEEEWASGNAPWKTWE